ncbi:rhodanese-like domain-containing protein [Oceanisphaera sp. IT1-181]|uniref:rhodanese-like domain-containing protein n=1 Tax=Oceanisphaera sp. IT1-181 TaxID=3081199 RepID=UPI0029CA69BD|nr:rhodanese-like domain-containing protein [Oceanisphaera sp. IT1-181]
MKFWTLALTSTIAFSGSTLANDAVWVDVASQQDYALEHLVEAIHIPHTYIARGVSARFPDKTTPLKLYDRDQVKAQRAQEALQTLGYIQVTNSGDLAGLKAHGQSTVQSIPTAQNELLPTEALNQGEPFRESAAFSQNEQYDQNLPTAASLYSQAVATSSLTEPMLDALAKTAD